MTSISLRAGGALGRRLLPGAAISAVATAAATAAAPCHRQVHPLSPLSSATPVRSTSLPYLPQVDLLSPAILLGQYPSPTSFSSMTYADQVDGVTPAMTRRLDSLTDGARTTSGSSSAPRQRQAETAPGLLRRGHLYTRITVSCLTSASYDPRAYAGGASSFRRRMSSAASPSDDAPGKGVPSGSNDHTTDGEKIVSTTPTSDTCKYDEEAVLTRLDRIDGKVDRVDAKLEQTVTECAKLTKEIGLLKKRQESSGDWTSFRIRGKTLNWLSVGSTAWEIIKAYFK